MSRPIDPAWVVPTFASTTNYPAGPDPWAATPTKVAPPVAYFVPNTPNAAEYYNYVYRQAFDTDASAKTYIGTLKNATWDEFQPSHAMTFTKAAFTAIFPPAYNVLNYAWFASGNIGGGDFPFYSYDGGTTWTAQTWPSAPTNKPIMGAGLTLSVAVDGTSNKAYYWNGTWQLVTAGIAASVIYRQITYLDGTAHAVNKFIAVGSVSGVGSKIITGNGSVNWTDASAAIPAPLAGNTITKWHVASSTTRTVCLPVVTAGTAYMTTDDAVTFTQRAYAGDGPLAGEQVSSLAYSQVDGIFMACLSFLAAGQLRWISSPDGLNWTQCGVITEPNLVAYALNCAGSTWLQMVTRNSGLGANVERTAAFYSVDKGATWRVSDYALSVTGGGTDVARNGVSTDGNRFLINTADVLHVGTATIGLRPALP